MYRLISATNHSFPVSKPTELSEIGALRHPAMLWFSAWLVPAVALQPWSGDDSGNYGKVVASPPKNHDSVWHARNIIFFILKLLGLVARARNIPPPRKPMTYNTWLLCILLMRVICWTQSLDVGKDILNVSWGYNGDVKKPTLSAYSCVVLSDNGENEAWNMLKWL